MRNLILLLVLSFLPFMAKSATVSQGFVSSITIGGVTTSTSQALVLVCSGSNTAFDSMRLNGVAYQVPTGKKLRLLAARTGNSTSASVTMGFGYADVSVTNSTSPTGQVTFVPSGAVNYTSVTQPAAAGYSEAPIPYLEVPSAKYPNCVFAGVGFGIVLGVLI